MDEAVKNAKAISADEFQAAVAACRKDRELADMYDNAPQGAKMFLGLLFYQMHFGDKADNGQVNGIFSEIQHELTFRDVDYLLDCPVIDDDERRYLDDIRVLLAKRRQTGENSRDQNAAEKRRRAEQKAKEEFAAVRRQVLAGIARRRTRIAIFAAIVATAVLVVAAIFRLMR